MHSQTLVIYHIVHALVKFKFINGLSLKPEYVGQGYNINICNALVVCKTCILIHMKTFISLIGHHLKTCKISSCWIFLINFYSYTRQWTFKPGYKTYTVTAFNELVHKILWIYLTQLCNGDQVVIHKTEISFIIVLFIPSWMLHLQIPPDLYEVQLTWKIIHQLHSMKWSINY
jgi:hypothetical protein